MNKKITQGGFSHPLLLALIVAVVSVVGFAGYRVVNYKNSKNQLNNSEQKTNVEQADTLPTNLDGLLTTEKIKELSAQSSPQATVVGLELESDNGILIYKVKLSNGTVLKFDAKSGQPIIKADTSTPEAEAETEESDDLPANFTINITFDKAREIAQAQFPDSKIRKIELDVEAGVVVLSVRFTDKARVDINAADGKIVSAKAPNEEKKSSEAKDNKNSNPGSRSSSSGSSDSSSPSSGREDESPSQNNDSPSSTNSNSGSGSSEIRAEGILRQSDGVYVIAYNGATYTIRSNQDLSNWIGRTVRAEGVLQPDNVIAAEKVELR